MKNKLLPCLFCVFLFLSQNAHAVNLDKRFSKMRRSYDAIRTSINLGDSKQDVITKLEKISRPFKNHIPGRDSVSLQLENKKAVDVYYMRLNWYADELDTDDEYIPYVFLDNSLVEIGWKLLGGSKTKHDPARVEYLNQVRMQRIMQALAIQSMVTQSFSNASNAFNSVSNKFNAQAQQQQAEHNQNIQQQQMRELNRNLMQINTTLRKF
jgi:hypothetical protein